MDLQWLKDVEHPEDLSARITGLRLILATMYGTVIALMHWAFRHREGDRPRGLGVTLVLLCVLVALVTHVIGNSVARAFGLVGALSIVRFRTSVSDTRDTSFVIFAVAVGMAVGAGYLKAALVALPVVALLCLGAWLLDEWGVPMSRRGKIKIRAASVGEAEAAIASAAKKVRRWLIQGCATGKKNGAIELEFTVKLAPDTEPAALIAHLRQQPGILRVTWTARQSP